MLNLTYVSINQIRMSWFSLMYKDIFSSFSALLLYVMTTNMKHGCDGDNEKDDVHDDDDYDECVCACVRSCVRALFLLF